VIVHNVDQDPGAGLETFKHGSRSPWSRGSRSPKLLGVLLWVERNSRPVHDLLKCCHSDLCARSYAKKTGADPWSDPSVYETVDLAH
jgi:hypothetical protein